MWDLHGEKREIQAPKGPTRGVMSSEASFARRSRMARFSPFIHRPNEAMEMSLQSSTVCMYVALTYIPGGGLLTGFAMRSDPNVFFENHFLTQLFGLQL